MNWLNPFRHVDVWDQGRRVMQIEFRVVNHCPWLDTFHDQDARFGRPYMLEIIVRGDNGTHTFADSLCDGELRPSGWSDRCQIGRYVYDWSSSGQGDDFEITNGTCQITIHVDRDKNGTLVADVTDRRVFVTRPQWGRFWRRPKVAA